MSLRRRIMLLVALGMVVAIAPFGLMGMTMLQSATARVLEERLTMTHATADHLNLRIAFAWGQLDRIASQIAPLWRRGDRPGAEGMLDTNAPQLSVFSGGLFVTDGRRVLSSPREPPPAWPPSALLRTAVVGETLVRRSRLVSALIRLGEVPAIILTAGATAGGEAIAVGGVIDLRSSILQPFVNGLAIGQTGHAAIVDADGWVLASTVPQMLFTRDEHAEFLGDLVRTQRHLVGPTDEPGLPGDAGGRHVMAFAPLPDVSWGLAVGQEEAEILAPIFRLRNRVLLLGAAILLAALLAAWLDTRSVIAPLRLLRGAAERIAAGDLRQEIAVRRGDEIGGLARSFEEMRTQLLRSMEENTRLQEQLQSLAVTEERERIAREIHDNVGQVLGYVNTKAQAVRMHLDAGRHADARRQLAELENAARGVYADLREAILGLRTETSPERRLFPALEEYVRRFSELSGVATQLVVEGDPAGYIFPPSTELHLIRIIQEALTNVRKHAMATRGWVRFGVDAGDLTITVSDDGVGIAPTAPHGGPWPRFGLQTMRERAEAIGATFTVGSRDGAGTVITVRLPAMAAGKGEHRARAAGG